MNDGGRSRSRGGSRAPATGERREREMRARRTALILAAAAGVAVAVVVARRATRAPRPQVRTGTFSNGIAYEAIGDGPRTMIFLPGGPGMIRLVWVRVGARILRPLAAAGFTVWRLARRRGVPTGHTIEDMADDVAHVIDEAFDGHVDAVVGVSMGGLIALYLAARRPDAVGRVALVASSASISARSLEAAGRYGEALGHERFTEAALVELEDMVPGERRRRLRRLLAALLGRVIAASGNNPPDVLVETRAIMDADARPVLHQITAPVLIIVGDQDLDFPPDIVEETARLIPDCTVVRYEGRDHGGATFDKRAPGDVLDFLDRDR